MWICRSSSLPPSMIAKFAIAINFSQHPLRFTVMSFSDTP